MNDVETAAFARYFGANNFRWRNVKFGRGKCGGKTCDIVRAQKYDQINIMCDARLAVEHCGNTAAHEIPNSEIIERPDKQFDQVRFGHEGKCFELRCAPRRLSNRDAGCAGKPLCAGAW